jgi:hypothetical protein
MGRRPPRAHVRCGKARGLRLLVLLHRHVPIRRTRPPPWPPHIGSLPRNATFARSRLASASRAKGSPNPGDPDAPLAVSSARCLAGASTRAADGAPASGAHTAAPHIGSLRVSRVWPPVPRIGSLRISRVWPPMPRIGSLRVSRLWPPMPRIGSLRVSRVWPPMPRIGSLRVSRVWPPVPRIGSLRVSRIWPPVPRIGSLRISGVWLPMPRIGSLLVSRGWPAPESRTPPSAVRRAPAARPQVQRVPPPAGLRRGDTAASSRAYRPR